VQLNYHFLKQLSSQLNELLVGASFIESYCQEKDELIISLQLKNNELFIIRATLTSSFSCLSFPKIFNRSRKNSVNLFEGLNDECIVSVYQFKNERAFSFVFQSGKQLLFKMFGNRSNIILIEKNGHKVLFKNSLPKDKDIAIERLDRDLNNSFEDFSKFLNFQEQFPTFGNAINPWLEEKNYQNLSPEEKWKLLVEVEKTLDGPTFFLCRGQPKPVFSLLKTSECESLPNDPIAAINAFYLYFSKTYFFETKKENFLRVLLKKKKQIENYINKSEQKLSSLFDGPQPKEIGDIIMANLHGISIGQSEVTLFNFYSESDIKIRLNKKLSPQKNAENYYRKGKNRKIEEASIAGSIGLKKGLLSRTLKVIEQIELCESGKALNVIIKENELEKSIKKKAVNVPYKEFIVDGFRIWVGKNAKANDELTLKYSYKEDLWLHAKDVPGSHLIIKYESSRAFNHYIIEKSAEIAAYYSKRKTDSLAPVIYTPAKFVRKRKGSLPGQVVVEKEKVILVTPKRPSY